MSNHGGKNSCSYFDYDKMRFKKWITHVGSSTGINIIRDITEIKYEDLWSHGRKIHIFISNKNFAEETMKCYHLLSQYFRDCQLDKVSDDHEFIIHFMPNVDRDESDAFIHYLKNLVDIYREWRDTKDKYLRPMKKNIIKSEYSSVMACYIFGAWWYHYWTLIIRINRDRWDLVYHVICKDSERYFSMLDDMEMEDQFVKVPQNQIKESIKNVPIEEAPMKIIENIPIQLIDKAMSPEVKKELGINGLPDLYQLALNMTQSSPDNLSKDRKKFFNIMQQFNHIFTTAREMEEEFSNFMGDDMNYHHAEGMNSEEGE